jgi:hypothetical protein
MKKIGISEVTAKNIALEKIKRDLQGDIELVEFSEPTGGLAYCLNGRNPADYYFFHVNPPRPAVGESRIICISKKSGEIVFDGYVGE